MKNFRHPLMENNILKEDNMAVINFLKKNDKLTNGNKVLEFEKRWSKWLGCKYSVFVNSGSSANLISIHYLKYLGFKGEIILPALNWVSDVSSVILCGFTPVFVDINLNNLGACEKEIEKKISKNTVAIFLTHILGFNALSKNLLNLIKKRKIILIEDVCESHGASFKNKKLGNFGLCSNFSFYYAHHMSTIEGGMVSTNDRRMYDVLRMMRSHGMLRESKFKDTKKNIAKCSKLNSDFIFFYPSFNLRSTEINAVYGLNQIKRLDQNIKKRNQNFKLFLKLLNEEKYFTKYNISGVSNYAFTILFQPKYQNLNFREKFEKILNKYHIEFRRGMSGGGNQTLQPYIKYFKNIKIDQKNFTNVNKVHNYGYYIGNYPTLTQKKIKSLCKILNSI